MTKRAIETISVALGDRGYPIHIGEGLIGADLADFIGAPQGRQIALFTNPTIGSLYADQVLAALAEYDIDVFTMPDGEAHKNLATYNAALDFLMAHRHNRTTCLIALGGGVVGDLTGFVAATFQRGVDFVQIPTTLLAQVDSSVGGKTAVNHERGKNMVGAFYQPKSVVIDIGVLNSLPRREYAAGLAEVVKYGIIYDREFFEWLETHVEDLNRRDVLALTQVIRRSCEIKAEVVAVDEREGGLRAILNFGHTFGHAIENLAGYGNWLHGEAVAVGMVMAAQFSERLNRLPQGNAKRIGDLLNALDLPTALNANTGGEIRPEAMLEAMGMDKKSVDGRIRFIAANEIGEVELISDYEDTALIETLNLHCLG